MSDHDIYLVASLSDAQGKRQYRTVAAFRSSTETLACRTAWRLLVLLRNPFNAQAVASELRGLGLGLADSYLRKAHAKALKLEAETEQSGWYERQCVPSAPYLAGLVLSGYRLSETTGFPRFLEVLNHTIEPRRNTITVIDVSEQGRPAYCHVASVGGSPKRPLSAEDYIAALCPELGQDNPALKDEVSDSLAGLANAQLVGLAVLAATWPQVFESTLVRQTWRGDGRDEEAERLERDFAIAKGELGALSVHDEAARVVPLKQQALHKLLTGIMAESTSSAESMRALSDLVDSPILRDSLPTVRGVLENVETLNDAGFMLLKALVAAESSKMADLTLWTTARRTSTGGRPRSLISDKQIIDLGPGLAARRIDALDISGHPEISATQLSSLVGRIPTLTKVVALHCPNVDAGAGSSLLASSPAVAFVRTSILHYSFARMRVSATGTSWPEFVDSPVGKPAPALSVFVASAAYEFYSRGSPVHRDSKAHVYGCELPSFTKAGVAAGFFWLLEHLFNDRGAAGKAGRFDFRAGFHRLDGSMRIGKDWIVEDGRPATREVERLAMGRSMGGLPTSLVYPPDRQMVLPRCPGWTLVVDVQPFTNWAFKSFAESVREYENDQSLLRPRYAFVRWADKPRKDGSKRPQTIERVPVQVVSYKTWLSRLPSERGAVDAGLTEAIDRILESQQVAVMTKEQLLETDWWAMDMLRAEWQRAQEERSRPRTPPAQPSTGPTESTSPTGSSS